MKKSPFKKPKIQAKWNIPGWDALKRRVGTIESYLESMELEEARKSWEQKYPALKEYMNGLARRILELERDVKERRQDGS